MPSRRKPLRLSRRQLKEHWLLQSDEAGEVRSFTADDLAAEYRVVGHQGPQGSTVYQASVRIASGAVVAIGGNFRSAIMAQLACVRHCRDWRQSEARLRRV